MLSLISIYDSPPPHPYIGAVAKEVRDGARVAGERILLRSSRAVTYQRGWYVQRFGILRKLIF